MYRFFLPLSLAFACCQMPVSRCCGQYVDFQPYVPAGVRAVAPAAIDAQVMSAGYMPHSDDRPSTLYQAHVAFQQLAEGTVTNAFEPQGDHDGTDGKHVSLSFTSGALPAGTIAQYDSPVLPGPEPTATESYAPMPLTGASAACIPDCRHGSIHILDYPGVLAQIDCCPDNSTGNCDRSIRRFFDYNQALRCCPDPKCIICVQEPFICEKVCHEEQEVVFFRCYQKCEPYSHARCEDQRCIQEVGQRTVKKLDPCKAKIKVPVKRIVVEYRKVWICIDCPPYPGAEPRPGVPM